MDTPAEEFQFECDVLFMVFSKQKNRIIQMPLCEVLNGEFDSQLKDNFTFRSRVTKKDKDDNIIKDEEGKPLVELRKNSYSKAKLLEILQERFNGCITEGSGFEQIGNYCENCQVEYGNIKDFIIQPAQQNMTDTVQKFFKKYSGGL